LIGKGLGLRTEKRRDQEPNQIQQKRLNWILGKTKRKKAFWGKKELGFGSKQKGPMGLGKPQENGGGFSLGGKGLKTGPFPMGLGGF